MERIPFLAPFLAQPKRISGMKVFTISYLLLITVTIIENNDSFKLQSHAHVVNVASLRYTEQIKFPSPSLSIPTSSTTRTHRYNYIPTATSPSSLLLTSPSRSRFSKTSTQLNLFGGGQNWWEDDLPNILGINPIEAALIFGVLYYVYGPGVLYEYAREAGKLFSTYAPIVKDVSLDIFKEFRDYFEEDRDREMLKKSGVDVSSMPRRTSNVLERFQQGLEAFSDMTDVKQKDAKDELRRAYTGSRDDVDIMTNAAKIVTTTTVVAAAAAASGIATANALDSSTISNGDINGDGDGDNSGGNVMAKRKSKKQVLLDRNVDISKIIDASNVGASVVDAELAEVILLYSI